MIADLLLDLYPRDIITWVLRLLILPAALVLLTWLIHILFIQFEKDEMPLPIRRRLALNKSLIVAILIANFYWFFLIWHNSWELFHWDAFPFNMHNLYFALLPLLFCYGLLVFWFHENNVKIKNQL